MYSFLGFLCLMALHKGSNSMGAYPVDGGFLFDYNNIIDYEMPESCNGQRFCFEKGDHYPEEKVENLLESMPASAPTNARLARSIKDDADVIGNPDCAANTTFIDKPIYYILDENDQVRVVVQSPKFQQIYSVKWCLHPGRITKDTPHFLMGSRTLTKYKIECVDTLMNFDFFVLNEDFGVKLEVVRAKGGIPVCCRCKYSKLNDD